VDAVLYNFAGEALPCPRSRGRDTCVVAARVLISGKALRYGDGTVLLWQVEIPVLPSPPEIRQINSGTILNPADSAPHARYDHRWPWRVGFGYRGEFFRFQTDLPARYLAFRPVAVSDAFARRFARTGAFDVFDDSLQKVTGRLKFDDTINIGARTREENTRVVYVTSQSGLTGWVHIPELSETKTGVFDLVNGIVTALVGKWQDAARDLQSAIDNPKTTTVNRVAAYLFIAYAKERAGENGREEIERALELDPGSERALTYLFMSRFAELSRVLRDEKGGEERTRSDALIEQMSRELERRQASLPTNERFAHFRSEVARLKELATARREPLVTRPEAPPRSVEQ